jgi:putative transposase
VKNVAVLVAIRVGLNGHRQILGVCEGTKEDTESWRTFLRHLKERGLGVRMTISDKCVGLVETLGEIVPEAAWQRCAVHFYRYVLKDVPRTKAREIATMLKAVHAQEDRDAARHKSSLVDEKLCSLRLEAATKCFQAGVEETLSYMSFPSEHWVLIRSNKMFERVMKEIRRGSRVVGDFPDGNSVLMLAAPCLRYIAGTQWGSRHYLDMDRIDERTN